MTATIVQHALSCEQVSGTAAISDLAHANRVARIGRLMERASETPAGVAFGRFQVTPHRRELFADGQPIKLGGRAFDVLMALIEARGAVVGKRALIARVWPDRVVDDNNLQSQIAALRAAFGAERDLILTVSGRGYQFTGEVRVPSGSPVEHPAARLASAVMLRLRKFEASLALIGWSR